MTSVFDASEAGVRTRHWALAMTRLPSVTGTVDEARFAHRLADLLASEPALARPHVHIRTIEVADDGLERACLMVLVRGSGARTVVLSGHFDTVGIEDYGALAPLATEPERLHDALLAHLRNAQANAAQERARADLESGLFLPGRGLLDMKAGLAVALALAEQHATTPDRHGNLLVLAVPDEEANSAGARQAAASLPAIAGEYGLELCAAINLDSIADDGDGSRGRSVAMGSVGKLLPVALVVGRATHACYPLAGINAGALAGAIAAAMEWSPDLAARHAEAPAVPPTLLAIKDGKSQYDVTTPEQAFAYWNVLTYGRSPQSILETFRAHCERVCAEVMRRLAVVAGATDGAGAPDVRVLDVAELRALAAARTPRIDAELATALASARALPIPEQCRIAMTRLWQASGLAGPAVITGFGSIPYLPVSLGTGVQARRLAAAVTAATADVGRRHGTRITETTFFPGISDVSFLGEADTASVPVIAANTAAWGHAFRWPERNATAGIPTINAGPWGRDYHTPLERLHVPYAFVVLPELVAEIVTTLLDGD